MNDQRFSPSRVVLATIVSTIVAFLFLHTIELLINYMFSRKPGYSKVIYYYVTYIVLAFVYGLGISVVSLILMKLTARKTSLRPDSLLLSLNVAGFLFLYVFVVLNAHYLPYLSLLSISSLLMNVGLLCLCLLFSFFFYSVMRSIDSSPPVYGAMSLNISLAVALVILHALLSRRLEGVRLGLLGASGVMLLFIVVGIFVGLTEAGVFSVIGRRRASDALHRLSRRWFFAKAIIVLIVLAAVVPEKGSRPVVEKELSSESRPQIADEPNIILMVLDTVRQDRLSTYGCERETSPNLSKFAQGAWVFDAYSTASWTLPSHATIFTGLYPTENGTGPVRNYQLDHRNVTLAEVLAENGWATAAIVSNYLVMGYSSGFDQGFQYYDADYHETAPAFSFFASYILNKVMPRSSVFTFHGLRRAESINKEALRWIRNRDNEPFFIFMNYMDAHAPYVPPPPYNRRWYSGSAPADFFSDVGVWNRYWNEFQFNVNEGKREVTDSEREFLLSQYDGEIAYLDNEIGKFMEKLQELEVFDDSLIIITSDHGEFFCEHGLLQHPRSLHQELIRVPLIVKPPAGRKHDPPPALREPVSLVDLFHSILEYVGVSHTATRRNNFLNGRRSGIFSESHTIRAEGDPEATAEFDIHLHSLIEGDLKLIYSSEETYMLYDLSADPSEFLNLLAQGSSDDGHSLSALKTKLTLHIDRISIGSLESAKLSPKELNEIQSRLKALGYIQ